jgi:hypothetical protein
MHQHEFVTKFLIEDKQRDLLRHRSPKRSRPPTSERRWVRPRRR